MTSTESFRRGIVLPYPVRAWKDGFGFGGPESPDDARRARFAALYFDLARYAGARGLFGPVGHPDIETLKARRFLVENRTLISSVDGSRVNGSNQRMDHYLIRSALESAPDETKGRWSILYENYYQDAEDGDINAIILSLHNRMPVPDNSVGIKEVLAFNASHRADLQRLRRGVNHLAERLANAASKPDIANVVRDEIDYNFDSLSVSLEKKKFPFGLFSIDVGFMLPSDALNLAMQAFGVPGVIAGPISNSVSFTFARKKSLPNLAVDFSYCLKAAKL